MLRTDWGMLTDGVVQLAPPERSDAVAMAAAVQASIDTLAIWMPWATPDYSAESALEWMDQAAATNVHGFVIRDTTGTILGTCGLQRIDGFNRCIELGYWIGSAHTGKGYATRAARLAITYAFDDLDFHRVEILISVHNRPSQRVAERLGATLDATLAERILNRGQWHDAHLYSLISPAD